jgi:DNA repair protein RadA/Sms
MRIKFTDSFEIGTNIQDVKVPLELLRRHRTGVEWVDEGLGGEGFTPSMVTMFTGEPGAGKTTALLSMASGLVENGAVCLFNTAEESLFQVKRTVDRLRLPGNFAVGNETHVDTIIEGADRVRNLPQNKGKPFFLMVDSLQCLDDGKFDSGRITCWTAERALEKLVTWAKENFTNVIVIGQVTKGGTFAGSNKMKHMVDAHMHLSWERKDKDLLGHRKFAVPKNRFGGCNRTSWLSLGVDGFHITAVEEG